MSTPDDTSDVALERCLSGAPGVRECVVRHRVSKTGESRVVAYVVSLGAPQIARLRSHCEREEASSGSTTWCASGACRCSIPVNWTKPRCPRCRSSTPSSRCRQRSSAADQSVRWLRTTRAWVREPATRPLPLRPSATVPAGSESRSADALNVPTALVRRSRVVPAGGRPSRARRSAAKSFRATG